MMTSFLLAIEVFTLTLWLPVSSNCNISSIVASSNETVDDYQSIATRDAASCNASQPQLQPWGITILTSESTSYQLAKALAIDFNECQSFGCSNISIVAPDASLDLICDQNESVSVIVASAGQLHYIADGSKVIRMYDDFTLACLEAPILLSEIQVAHDLYLNVYNDPPDHDAVDTSNYLSFAVDAHDVDLAGYGMETLPALSDEERSESMARLDQLQQQRNAPLITHFYGRYCGDLWYANLTVWNTTESVCNTESTSTHIRIEGSSTLYSASKVWSCNYMDWTAVHSQCTSISVNGGGSSLGATSVCSDSADVDIGAMSRQWRESEATLDSTDVSMSTWTCSVAPYHRLTQIEVAVDGITVFVRRGSALQQCLGNGLSWDALRWIFSNSSSDAIKRWDALNVSCPAQEVVMFAPDGDSGTQSFFVERVFEAGDSFSSSGSILLFAEHELIAQGVVSNEFAIGFSSYAHYATHADELFAVALCSANCWHAVNYEVPSADTIASGHYALTRKLYLNVKQTSWPKVWDWMQFGLSRIGQRIVTHEVGFVVLDDDDQQTMIQRADDALQAAAASEEAEGQTGGDCSSDVTDTRFGLLDGDETFLAVSNASDSGSSSVSPPVCASSLHIAGSTTVYATAKIWTIEYMLCDALASGCQNQTSSISVEGGGSSSGARRVCSTGSDHVQIGDMSREWKRSEAVRYWDGYTLACRKKSPHMVTRVPVAIDGLTLFVKRGGAAQRCIDRLGGLSLAALRWMYSSYSMTQLASLGLELGQILSNLDTDTLREWSDLSAAKACDSSDISSSKVNIVGPNPDLGSWEFFGDLVFPNYDEGETFALDRDYVGYSDVDGIAQHVADDEFAIGFTGYSHYLRYEDVLYAVPISTDRVGGCTDVDRECGVAASAASFESGAYPFSRYLFMNIEHSALASNELLYSYLRYGFSANWIAEHVGYVALSDEFRSELVANIIDPRGNVSIEHYYQRDCGVAPHVVDLTYANCGDGNDDDDDTNIKIGGSSTAFPIAATWACNYIDFASYLGECRQLRVSSTDSSEGARALCSQTVDIATMSRQFTDTEAVPELDGFTWTCRNDQGVRLTQMELVHDAIAVFVQRDSALQQCLANVSIDYAVLRWIFSNQESASGSKQWSELSSECPPQHIQTVIPDATQASRSFFAEQVFGGELASGFDVDATVSSDPAFILASVANHSFAIGFGVFGGADFEAMSSMLYALPICAAADDQCVTVSASTVASQNYPLSRKIYMNVRQSEWPRVGSFVQFGLGEVGQAIIEDELIAVPLTEDELADDAQKINGSDTYQDYAMNEVQETTTSPPVESLSVGVLVTIICLASVFGVGLLVAVLCLYARWKQKKTQNARSAA